MTDNDGCCPVCGATRDDIDYYGLCAISDSESDEPSDDWEEDNCLALELSMQEHQARHDELAATGKLSPPPPWAIRLMAALEPEQKRQH